jgi:hypothetical protein
MESELLVAMIFPSVNAATPERVGNSEQIKMNQRWQAAVPNLFSSFVVI